MSKLAYRPDIDGLRAIAVMAVLLFHANIQAIRGGFVGVDIFFVISGFLITAILMKDIQKRPLSLVEYFAEFYERRIRRIFPALFAVFAASTAAAWLLLFPSELANFGASLASSTLFASNIFFLTQENYFAAPSETMPLLHTWSLSVEEQFYIFFPPILLAIAKFGERRFKSYIVLLTLSSLVLSGIMVELWMPGAFFLAMPRAWELMVGSLLALGTFRNVAQGRVAKEFLSVLGISLIAYAIFAFDKGTPFPGLAALLPVLGAALVIHSGEGGKTLVSRALALKPMVFLGLISYSLYLWHSPVLVFCKIALTQNMPRMEKIAVLLLCLVLATLSWWFIERPFRNRNFLTRKQLFTASAFIMAIFSAIGLSLYWSGGAESRYPAEVSRLASYTSYDPTLDSRDGQCFLSSTFNDIGLFDKNLCLKHDNVKPNWLLMGDSHAAHLYTGISRIYHNVNVQQATASGCKPVVNGKGPKRCTLLRDDLFTKFIPEGKADVIILSARWNKNDTPDIVKTVEYLSKFNKPIFIMGPIVEYKLPLPRILAMAELTSNTELLKEDRADHDIRELDAAMEKALQGTSATYISTYRTLCPDTKTCATTVSNGIPLQFDYGHLTRTGSIWAATQWEATLASATLVKPGVQTPTPTRVR